MLDHAFPEESQLETRAASVEKLLLANAFKTQRNRSPRPINLRKSVVRVGDEWRSRKTKFNADVVAVKEIEVADITEVAEAIDAAANDGSDYNRTLLLGTLTEHGRAVLSNADVVRRWAHDTTNRSATFCDAPCHVHFLDIDALVLPEGYKLTDPIERLGYWLRSLFPDDLSAAAMYVQATGSHGTTDPSGRPVPRLRAAFWLSQPITLREWKMHVTRRIAPHAALKAEYVGTSPLDVKIYSPGHYIFVLPPRIEGEGSPYPGIRSAVIDGDRWEVELDPLPRETDESLTIEEGARLYRDGANRWRERESDAELFDSIAPGNVHGPLRALLWRLAWRHNESPALEEAVRQLEISTIRRLREISRSHEEAELRIDEHITGGKLLRSACAAAAKQLNQVVRPVEQADPISRPVVDQAASSEAIKKAVSDAVRSALDDGKVRVDVVRAPPGAGKTHALIQAIEEGDLYRRRVLYLAPDHGLAAQTAEDLRAKFSDPEAKSRIRHWRGRSQKGVCKNEALDPIACKLEAAGVSPRRTVCTQCELATTCQYILRAQDDEPGVVVLTHADLTSLYAGVKSSSKRMADLTVVDESLLQAFLSSGTVTGTLDLLSDAHLPVLSDGFSISEIADLSAVRTSLQIALRHATGGCLRPTEVVPLQDFARERASDERKAQGKLRAAAEALYTSVDFGDGDHAAAMDRYRLIADRRNASRFAEAVWTAIALHGEASVPRSYVKGVSINDTGEIRVCIAPEMPALVSDRPTIVLDATANENLSRRIYLGGSASAQTRDMSVHNFAVRPGAYRLVQVPGSTFSKSKLLRHGASMHASSDLSKLRRIIFERAAYYARNSNSGAKDVLVISQLQIENALGWLPANVATAHFNSLRGLNDFKDVPCVIVIGRPLPSSKAIEEMADALSARDPEAGDIASIESFEYAPKRLQRRYPDGEIDDVEVDAPWHPSPLCDALLEQVLAEVVQAVGRARVTRRDKDNPCEIIVFGQHQTGLPVDRFVLWSQYPDPGFDGIAHSLKLWPANAEARRQMLPDLASKAKRTIANAARSLSPPTDSVEVSWRMRGVRLWCRAHSGSKNWKKAVRRFLGSEVVDII